MVLALACGDDSSSSDSTASTRRQSLAGAWKFRADPDDVGRAERWFAADTDETAWQDAAVPGNWNFLFRDSLYPDAPNDYDGVAWYRVSFVARAAPADGRVRLYFGAVSYRTTVWVNGVEIGTHEGDFLPFEFGVTGALRLGEANTLALRVEAINRQSVETLPPAVGRYDYWIYSGVYREVYLQYDPPVAVYDVFAHGEPTGRGGAAVDVAVSVLNTGQARQRVRVRASIREKGTRRPVATVETEAEIPAASLGTVALRAELAHARPWSPTAPALYECVVEIAEASDGEGGGADVVAVTGAPFDARGELPPHATLGAINVPAGALDAAAVTFGIRAIETRGDQILLNGEPVFFTGINRHDEYPLLGRTLPDDIYEADLATMKRLGINALRTAHYPNDPRILDLADRMGFLVFEEIPATSLNPAEMQSGRVLDLARAQVRTMVVRDRNHPSIVLWSVGNEFFPSGRLEYNEPLYAEARAHDPTRLTGYARLFFDTTYPDPGADVVMSNVYFGWYTADINGLDPFLEDMHERFPDRPIIVSEYGADAAKDWRTDTDPTSSPHFSEDYQAYYLDETWRIMRSKPFVSGGFLWIYADFLTPQRQYLYSAQGGGMLNPYPYHNLKGIVTNERVPKNAFLTVMGMYRGMPRHDLTIQAQDAGGTPVANATVELILDDGTLGGRQLTQADGRIVFWRIPEQGYDVRAESGSFTGRARVELLDDAMVAVRLASP